MEDFLEQLEKHRHEFHRYVLRTVWDTGVAEDVFSSGVLAAWENRHKFRPGTNFRAWMYRILTNKCFVANRQTMRTPAPLESVPEARLMDMDAEPGYGDVLEDATDFLEQCGDEVVRAFKALSTPQRTCILLRSAEKFSYKEIADIMEIPVGTVMTHLSRGRAKLRQELLDYAREQGVVRSRPRLLPKPTQENTPRSMEGGIAE